MGQQNKVMQEIAEEESSGSLSLSKYNSRLSSSFEIEPKVRVSGPLKVNLQAKQRTDNI